jgi:hypothetical protein
MTTKIAASAAALLLIIFTAQAADDLPDAWGGDEFVDGPEWSQSGATGGMPGAGFPIPGLPNPARLPGFSVPTFGPGGSNISGIF